MKIKREEIEKQHQATLGLKQQEAIIEEQQHHIETERKQQLVKVKNNRQEQEYRSRMEKKRLEMEQLCEEYRNAVAGAEIVETEYLEETKIDQHLELSVSVHRHSERVNDWVLRALESKKRPEVVPSSLKFVTCINTESFTNQNKKIP